eukprot:820692-Rhodomonas_salina.1
MSVLDIASRERNLAQNTCPLPGVACTCTRPSPFTARESAAVGYVNTADQRSPVNRADNRAITIAPHITFETASAIDGHDAGSFSVDPHPSINFSASSSFCLSSGFGGPGGRGARTKLTNR